MSSSSGIIIELDLVFYSILAVIFIMVWWDIRKWKRITAENIKKLGHATMTSQATLEYYALQDDILLAFLEIRSWPNTPMKKKALEDTLEEMQKYTGKD